MCVCVCTHVHAHVCMHACMCGSALLPRLAVQQALPLFTSPVLELKACSATPSFSLGVGDLNSAPQACTACTLPSEPSLYPPSISLTLDCTLKNAKVGNVTCVFK